MANLNLLKNTLTTPIIVCLINIVATGNELAFADEICVNTSSSSSPQQQHRSSGTIGHNHSHTGTYLEPQENDENNEKDNGDTNNPSRKLQIYKDIFTNEQLEICQEFFYRLEDAHQKRTGSEIGFMALTAKVHTAAYSDIFVHRYDNFNELKVSGGPQVDQELCLKQLKDLNLRADIQLKERFESRDVNLHLLLDTFGRIPSGMFVGNAYWTGIYSECLRLKIDTPERKIPTRYCIASLRHHKWPKKFAYQDIAVLKTAVCLPKTCDSLNYKNKYELIHKLLETQSRDIDKGQSVMTSLFCLPDEESSLRIWWHSPETVLTVILFSSWILILIYSTIKCELHYKLLRKNKNLADFLKQSTHHQGTFGLTNGLKLETKDYELGRKMSRSYIRVYESLSITNNLRLLFNTTKPSALMEVGNKLKERHSSEHQQPTQKQVIEQDIDKSPPPPSSTPLTTTKDSIVDLRILEGIKVICMSYVILGHVLMCLTMVISNGREVSSSPTPSFFIANMVPAFAVNAFFTITGLLTSYLLFKQNQSHSFMMSPAKWVAFIVYRYMRIMPMYFIVVLYTKHLARYTSHGPMWDYGTTSLGQRRICQQESWLWTLLFGANFKSPLEHCIPSAWYLANDFQFFLITPIFLVILNKYPVFGQRLLKICMACGYIAGFLNVFYSEAEDLRPVTRFMPHGFKSYISLLSANYTRPQYRIPAYLCGLLSGFVLYQFEQNKIKFLAEKAKATNSNKEEDKNNDLVEPGWSDGFKKQGSLWSLFFVTLCCMSPVLGTKIPFNKYYAKLVLSFVMPSYHVLFSVAISIYTLLATTGYANKSITKFLSGSFWKPLARLSLCVVLINVEVTNYIIQSTTQTHYFDGQSQISMDIICILATYLAAIVVCVLFEAPIRAALNHLLSYAISKIEVKNKTKKMD